MPLVSLLCHHSRFILYNKPNVLRLSVPTQTLYPELFFIKIERKLAKVNADIKANFSLDHVKRCSFIIMIVVANIFCDFLVLWSKCTITAVPDAHFLSCCQAS